MFVGAKVVSHGRYVALQIAEVAIPRQMFQKDFAADSGTTAAAANNAGMRLPMGGVRANATENGPIVGSRLNLASV